MAQVFWDGREVGTTAICKNSLNPVWFNESAIGTRAQSEKSGNRHQPADDCNDTPYFWLESACSLNPRLRVEVYDWDAVGWHDFLGGVELDMDQMMNLQRTTLAKAKTTSSSNQQVCWRGHLPGRYMLSVEENTSGSSAATIAIMHKRDQPRNCLTLTLGMHLRRELTVSSLMAPNIPP